MKFLSNGLIAIGIFWGVSISIFAEFWTDFFGPSIQPSETLVATIFGAGIALSGTLISVLAMHESSLTEQYSRDEATVYTILTKLLSLNDAVMKNNRHFKTISESGRVFFGDAKSGKSFSKPLEGKSDHVAFSAEEMAALLRLGRAEKFNSINDMQGISDSLSFLRGKHLSLYYELMDEVQSGPFQRDGFAIATNIDSDSTRLLAVVDADGVFRSFLDRAAPEVEAFTIAMIEFVNERFGTGIAYSKNNDEPTAPNHLGLKFY